MFDSRSSSGLVGGQATAIPVAGLCGIPASARALVVNATAVSPSDDGELALYRDGDAPPVGGVVAFRAGRTRAGFAVLGVGPAGLLALARFPAGGSLDLVIDVSGYFE
jgi:hypothetical protein